MNISIIVGVVFIGFGLIFLLVSLLQMKKAKAAASWPVTTGVVLTSSLAERRSHNSKTHHTTITYEPKVQYEYSLMGQKFSGNRVTFGYASYDRTTAENKIAPYPQGGTVQVHYDPDDPSKAVLEPKAAGGTSSIVVAVIFFIVGLALLILKFI